MLSEFFYISKKDVYKKRYSTAKKYVQLRIFLNNDLDFWKPNGFSVYVKNDAFKFQFSILGRNCAECFGWCVEMLSQF